MHFEKERDMHQTVKKSLISFINKKFDLIRQELNEREKALVMEVERIDGEEQQKAERYIDSIRAVRRRGELCIKPCTEIA